MTEQNKNEVPYSIKSNPIPEFDHLKFLSKIRIDQQTQCWEWLGGHQGTGYGFMSIGPKKNKTSYKTHRLSYSLFKGELTPGLIIDHICKNRGCCNPEHLREVSYYINWSENSNSPTWVNKNKTHCKHSHEFTPDNTKIYRGFRICQACYVRNYKEASKRKARKMVGEE